MTPHYQSSSVYCVILVAYSELAIKVTDAAVLSLPSWKCQQVNVLDCLSKGTGLESWSRRAVIRYWFGRFFEPWAISFTYVATLQAVGSLYLVSTPVQQKIPRREMGK